MKQANKPSLSYRDAGVNIEQGNELVKRIKSVTANTHRTGVMGNIGGFAALFDLSALNYREPVLVSGTDGVGTKIKLAIEYNRHESTGIDLVAMCVNDLIVKGAEPLFFLDYFASAKLDIDIAETVIRGIAAGCKQAACSLIGGETAEMPGMYAEGDYDLAGFCVGVVEKSAIIDGTAVQNGDSVIAVASSGCHSNGYSLVRKVLELTHADPQTPLENGSLLDALMAPTRIYVRPILDLIKQIPVKAISHITGGGLLENITRVIPESLAIEIETSSWNKPAIFKWLQENGGIQNTEMYRTFNCGVGLVLCVNNEDTQTAINHLQNAGEQAWQIGRVTPSSNNAVILL